MDEAWIFPRPLAVNCFTQEIVSDARCGHPSAPGRSLARNDESALPEALLELATVKADPSDLVGNAIKRKRPRRMRGRSKTQRKNNGDCGEQAHSILQPRAISMRAVTWLVRGHNSVK